jgi:hypothetical protein
MLPAWTIEEILDNTLPDRVTLLKLAVDPLFKVEWGKFENERIRIAQLCLWWP